MATIILNRSSGYPALEFDVVLRSDGPSEATVGFAAPDASTARNLDLLDSVELAAEIEEAGQRQRVTLFTGLVDSAEAEGTDRTVVQLRCTSAPWRRLMMFRPESKITFKGCEYVTGSQRTVCHTRFSQVISRIASESGVAIQNLLPDCTLASDIEWASQTARQLLEGVLDGAGYRASGMHRADILEQDGALVLFQRSQARSQVSVPYARMLDRRVSVDRTEWSDVLAVRPEGETLPLCVEGGALPTLVPEDRVPDPCPHDSPDSPPDPNDPGRSWQIDYRDCSGSRVISTMDRMVRADGSYTSKQWHYSYSSDCRLVAESGTEETYDARRGTRRTEQTTVSYDYDPVFQDRIRTRVEATSVSVETRTCVKTATRMREERWRYVAAQGEVYPEWHGVFEYGLSDNEMECGPNPTYLRRVEQTYSVRSGSQMVRRTTVQTFDADGNPESSRAAVEVSAGDWVGRGSLMLQVNEEFNRWFSEVSRRVLFTSGLPSWALPPLPPMPGLPSLSGAVPRLKLPEVRAGCAPDPRGVPPGQRLDHRPAQDGPCDGLAATASYGMIGDAACVQRVRQQILDEVGKRLYTLSAELVPTPEIRPGVRLTLSGDPAWGGVEWYVTQVRYRWSAESGLRQHVTALAWG